MGFLKPRTKLYKKCSFYIGVFVGLQCFIISFVVNWSRFQAYTCLTYARSGSVGENSTTTFEPLNKQEGGELVDSYRKQEAIMKARLNNVRKKCKSYTNTKYWKRLYLSGTVWMYPARNINYCITPKVGCTFWKRVLRFVSKDFPPYKNVQFPADIDRLFVHYGATSHIQQVNLMNPHVRNTLSTENTFMFTRDPYSRLWSAYIDKFFLPDFWRTYATEVVKLVRVRASDYEKKCAKNISFQEFLSYVVAQDNNMNEHWEPIHRLCSPCHVSFDAIGKQETFSDDAEFILHKYGFDNLIKNGSSVTRIQDEIVMLTKYNFELGQDIAAGCFDKLDVARRLWLAFQLNGYLDREIKFPDRLFHKTEFRENPDGILSGIVISTLQSKTRQGFDSKKQKRQMMVEAYRNIPVVLLQKIRLIYKYDFELYHYDSAPVDIYSDITIQ